MPAPPAEAAAPAAAIELYVAGQAGDLAFRLQQLFADYLVEVTQRPTVTGSVNWQGVPNLFGPETPNRVLISFARGRSVQLNLPARVEISEVGGQPKLIVRSDGRSVLEITRLRPARPEDTPTSSPRPQ